MSDNSKRLPKTVGELYKKLINTFENQLKRVTRIGNLLFAAILCVLVFIFLNYRSFDIFQCALLGAVLTALKKMLNMIENKVSESTTALSKLHENEIKKLVGVEVVINDTKEDGQEDIEISFATLFECLKRWIKDAIQRRLKK